MLDQVKNTLYKLCAWLNRPVKFTIKREYMVPTYIAILVIVEAAYLLAKLGPWLFVRCGR